MLITIGCISQHQLAPSWIYQHKYKGLRDTSPLVIKCRLPMVHSLSNELRLLSWKWSWLFRCLVFRLDGLTLCAVSLSVPPSCAVALSVSPSLGVSFVLLGCFFVSSFCRRHSFPFIFDCVLKESNTFQALFIPDLW